MAGRYGLLIMLSHTRATLLPQPLRAQMLVLTRATATTRAAKGPYFNQRLSEVDEECAVMSAVVVTRYSIPTTAK